MEIKKLMKSHTQMTNSANHKAAEDSLAWSSSNKPQSQNQKPQNMTKLKRKLNLTLNICKSTLFPIKLQATHNELNLRVE